MRFSVIKPFDPWKSPMCTCPRKWVLNTYTGCGHRCLYCYASSYIPNHFTPRLKKMVVERAEHDLKHIPRGALIEMSTSSDPYTPPESEKQFTRKLVHRVLSQGMRLLITTKSDLVIRDIDILSKHLGRVAVAITITTISNGLAKKLEPGAPPPTRRLEAIRLLRRAGIPTIVRVDPIIPYINDEYEVLRDLIKRVADAGALQITSSTYKARADNLVRMKRAFPALASKLDELYKVRGVRIHGYMYLEERLRHSYMRMVKEIAEEHGLIFESCREGFTGIGTPGFACDGSTFTFPEVYEELRRL